MGSIRVILFHQYLRVHSSARRISLPIRTFVKRTNNYDQSWYRSAAAVLPWIKKFQAILAKGNERRSMKSKRLKTSNLDFRC